MHWFRQFWANTVLKVYRSFRFILFIFECNQPVGLESSGSKTILAASCTAHSTASYHPGTAFLQTIAASEINGFLCLISMYSFQDIAAYIFFHGIVFVIIWFSLCSPQVPRQLLREWQAVGCPLPVSVPELPPATSTSCLQPYFLLADFALFTSLPDVLLLVTSHRMGVHSWHLHLCPVLAVSLQSWEVQQQGHALSLNTLSSLGQGEPWKLSF